MNHAHRKPARQSLGLCSLALGLAMLLVSSVLLA
jgi:hypothetical protein